MIRIKFNFFCYKLTKIIKNRELNVSVKKYIIIKLSYTRIVVYIYGDFDKHTENLV